jgi:CubicO group peptidase (beta-lactamase class C family)
LIAALTVASCRTSAPSRPAPRIPERLDAFFTDLHERGLFSGAVVVGNNRDVVWEKGFGYANVARHVAFTPDTPADGASLAKTFTAALVLMLAREGKLDLDAPAQRLLPELPYADVTLREMLSHSSGIPVADYDWFDKYLPPDRARTNETLLAVVAKQKPRLAFPPGTAFEYSSLVYDLAALAAARAAGETFGEALRERIFAPLGIESAFLRPARLKDFPGVRTMGYPHDVFDYEGFHGGSNIYISARDLHRWNQSFLAKPLVGSEALEPARIGDADSRLTLSDWYRSADGTKFWYSGHLQGFHSEVFRDMRARRSIVYVSNNTIEPWLQKAIVPAVNAILDGREPEPVAEPAIDALSKDDRVSMAGPWRTESGETLTVESSARGLTMLRDGVRYRMFPAGPRAYFVPGLDFIVGFEKKPPRIYVSTNVGAEWGSRP